MPWAREFSMTLRQTFRSPASNGSMYFCRKDGVMAEELMDTYSGHGLLRRYSTRATRTGTIEHRQHPGAWHPCLLPTVAVNLGNLRQIGYRRWPKNPLPILTHSF